MAYPGQPDPNDPKQIQAMSAAFEQATRSARSVQNEIVKMRDGLIRAKESGKDMGDMLSKAMDTYERSLEKGGKGTERLRKLILAYKEAVPELFGAMTDAGERWNAMSRRSFTDFTTGSGEMSERIRDLVRGYQRLHGVSADVAKSVVAARVGKEGVSGIYSMEGSLEAIRQDMVVRKAMKNEDIATSDISRRVARERREGRLIEKRLAEQTANATVAGAERAKRAAQEAAKSGGLKELTETPGLIGAAAEKLTRIPGKGMLGLGRAARGLMISEKAAAAGVAPGMLAGGVSTAIGALGKAIAPLSATLSGAALLSKAIIGAFSGVVSAQKIASGQVEVMATKTQVSYAAMTLASLGSSERIRRYSGLTVAGAGLIADTFQEEIVPAAQKAMMTFNTLDRSSSTVDEWTGSIAGAAVEGALFGKTYQETGSIMAKLGHAFGGTGREARNAFREIIGGGRAASLSMDQFSAVVGDAEDIGRRFGAGGRSIYGQMGYVGSLATRAGMVGGARREMALGSISNLMRDMPRLIGLGRGAGMNDMIERYVDAARAKDSGARMAELTRTVMSKYAETNMFGGQTPMEALKGKDKKQAWQASLLLSSQFGIAQEALLDPRFYKKFEQVLSGPGMYSVEGKKLRKEAAALAGDNTQAGMQALVNQQGVINTMSNYVERIFRILNGALILKGTDSLGSWGRGRAVTDKIRTHFLEG